MSFWGYTALALSARRSVAVIQECADVGVEMSNNETDDDSNRLQSLSIQWTRLSRRPHYGLQSVRLSVCSSIRASVCLCRFRGDGCCYVAVSIVFLPPETVANGLVVHYTDDAR